MSKCILESFMNSPTPEEIKKIRTEAGLTKTQSANLVGTRYLTWHRWELGLFKMPSATWELFLIKIKLVDD